jgi:3-deoxy-D-manno-octulosonic-acid transferase
MIYNPWDAPRFVKRALDSLEPRAYVAVETERWPTMLAELHARENPAILLNGRLSEESTERLLRFRSFWRGVLCCFTRLTVRFESDREKFLRLGVPEEKIIVTGDCKIDAMFKRKAEADPAKWAHLRKGGDAPVFIAGSTDKGEDEVVLEAFAKVRRVRPDARLIIVPRHPERALYVVAAALPYGKVDLFTDPTPDWDIMVVNKIGVLFELYSVVDAAFIGGSLTVRGGQNPMEPALFEIKVAHGPLMPNFPDTAQMDKLGAACVIENSDGLAEAWLRALAPEERERTRQASRKYFDAAGGAVQRSWNVIKSYI